MNEMNKLFIIIVTYNGEIWIKKCLESIPKQYEIIIVDNASIDTTVKFIREKFPQIAILPQSINLGFGAANNLGISYALKQGAEYVFLLNQDAYIEKDTIEKLIEVHKKNNHFGILSPIHLNGNGDKLDLNFSNYLFRNKEILFDSLQNKYIKTIYEVPFVNAAAWLIPKETLLNVGGFDPIFYHYGEDDNYCQRVLFHGYKVGVVPNTYIKHDRENRNTNQVLNFDAKLKFQERLLKFKWANLNIEIEDSIHKTKKNQLKLIVKLLLKFNYKNIKYAIKEYHLMNGVIPVIKKSRKINSNKGNHYIT